MKTLTECFQVVAFTVLLSLAAVGDTRAADSPEAIRAGLAAHDHAIHIKDGWIRDPYIVKGPDDWYYLTGTTQMPEQVLDGEARFNTGLGRESLVGWVVQVWRSRDLIDWEYLGVPFTLKDGVWYGSNRQDFEKTPEREWRLWAPELHWLGDRWALVHTSPAPLRSSNLALTEGAEVRPPWSQPLGTAIAHRHDPSLFRDDDATVWMVWGATEIAPLKGDYSGFAAEPVPIVPAGDFARMGHEGCLIRKIGAHYVLFGTGWSTGQMRKGSYNLYYATADRITGPYSERQFVGRFLGHGTPFQDDQGRWWCTAFYNANIPPLERAGIEAKDLSETAQTINKQGVTLVPLEVRTRADGTLSIRARDPAYASPGPDEAQQFGGPPRQ